MTSHIAVAGFAALLLGTLAACSTDVESPPGKLGELGERLVRTLCPGPPTEVEPVPNRHTAGQVDRLETRRCAAGSATLYIGQTTSNRKGLAVMVEVVTAGTGLPPYLEIGQPVQQALQRLGAPQQQTAGSATYDSSLEGNDAMTLRHSAGRITSVQWEWVVD